jgi:hypothetical protein
MESKFAFVVRTKIRPASIAKSMKSIIIRSDMKEALSRRYEIKNFARNDIDKKSGCEKSFIPEFEWY